MHKASKSLSETPSREEDRPHIQIQLARQSFECSLSQAFLVQAFVFQMRLGNSSPNSTASSCSQAKTICDGKPFSFFLIIHSLVLDRFSLGNLIPCFEYSVWIENYLKKVRFLHPTQFISKSKRNIIAKTNPLSSSSLFQLINFKKKQNCCSKQIQQFFTTHYPGFVQPKINALSSSSKAEDAFHCYLSMQLALNDLEILVRDEGDCSDSEEDVAASSSSPFTTPTPAVSSTAITTPSECEVLSCQIKQNLMQVSFLLHRFSLFFARQVDSTHLSTAYQFISFLESVLDGLRTFCKNQRIDSERSNRLDLHLREIIFEILSKYLEFLKIRFDWDKSNNRPVN